MDSKQILSMENISKSFGNVEVLHSVSFNLNAGEVHVLIGENGAGKSTLMKILSGVEKRTSGIIRMTDSAGKTEEIELEDPGAAKSRGIYMVYQESNLLDNLSIAENLYLGQEPMKHGHIDWPAIYAGAREQLDVVKCDLDPHTVVEKLSVAEKQTVEIARALSADAKILVFDEPTSSLSDREVEILFGLIEKAKESGIGIIYISHRMDEIFRIADRITVFRDGSLIGTVTRAGTTQEKLIEMMIGRQLSQDDEAPHSLSDGTPVKLSLRNIRIAPGDDPIDLDIYEGEIFGIFGLVGAGRTELARIIFGVDPIGDGSILVDGHKVDNSTTWNSIGNGFALLPEDRKRIGLIGEHSIKQNMLLVKLRELKNILLSGRPEKQLADEYIEKLSLVCQGIDQPVNRLSGGNQQKVVYAKWLMTNPKIMILDEPTRGIDVGVKAEIYSLMRELAKEKITIIMISSDLPEILRVSNRVAVMHDHRITLVERRELLDQKTIMEAAIQ